jgi:CRISPR/Cas system-associated exonuclease Cas4 (RecB family)
MAKGSAAVNKALRMMLGSKNTTDISTNAIDRFQESRNKRDVRSPKPTFSVSKLFYCPKGAFMDRAGISEINPCVSIRNMEVGTMMHEYLQDMLKEVYCNYGHVEERLTIPDFPVVGKIDGAIEDKGILVEIKTTGNPMGFRRGIPDYYVGQSMLYMWMWNQLNPKSLLDKAWFIVINRESMTWVDVPYLKYEDSIADKIVSDVRNYDKLWTSGQFPKIDSCKHCGYNYICGVNKKMKLADVLPGGKIRNALE